MRLRSRFPDAHRFQQAPSTHYALDSPLTSYCRSPDAPGPARIRSHAYVGRRSRRTGKLAGKTQVQRAVRREVTCRNWRAWSRVQSGCDYCYRPNARHKRRLSTSSPLWASFLTLAQRDPVASLQPIRCSGSPSEIAIRGIRSGWSPAESRPACVVNARRTPHARSDLLLPLTEVQTIDPVRVSECIYRASQ
jgi:hypothetical protein